MEMPNNKRLSSFLTFLASAVKYIEIPQNSAITCTMTDAFSQSEMTGHAEEECAYILANTEYICPSCTQSFSSVQLYTDHSQRHNSDLGPHTSIGARNLGKLFQNMNRENSENQAEAHGSNIPPACEDNRSLFHLSGKNIHINGSIKRSNSPKVTQLMFAKKESYFECNYCEAKFLNRDNIIKHVKENHLVNISTKMTSRGEKCYKCDICSYQYSHSKYLQYHKRQKHRLEVIEKKYRCDFCSNRYVRQCDLTKHKNIKHLSVLTEKINNKFECNICHVQFDTSRNVLVHKRNEHPLDQSDDKISRSTPAKKFDYEICQKKFLPQIECEKTSIPTASV